MMLLGHCLIELIVENKSAISFSLIKSTPPGYENEVYSCTVGYNLLKPWPVCVAE